MSIPLAGCSGGLFRSHAKGDPELTVAFGSTNRVLTFSQLLQAVPKAILTVNDPVYDKPKRYEGFWLEDGLKFADVQFGQDTVLILSALDGYQARLARLPGPQTKPLLAFRDLDRDSLSRDQLSDLLNYLAWMRDHKLAAGQ